MGTTKKILSTLISLAVLSSVLFFVINKVLEEKVVSFLSERVPSNISITYQDLDIATFTGTVTINKPSVAIANQSDSIIHTTVKADVFVMEDLSYVDYLFRKEIHIEDLKLFGAVVTYNKHLYNAVLKEKRDAPLKLYKPIIVDELSIDNARLTLYDSTKDSLALRVDDVTLEMDDIRIDSSTLLRKLPFDYSGYDLDGSDIFVKVGNYENLDINKLFIKDKQAEVRNITFKTKYTRNELSRVISKERDHFDLSIEKMDVDGLDVGFKEGRLFTIAKQLTLADVDATIFRDKLKPDDVTQKKLYSASLRQLDFDLGIDKALIKNGTLTYIEKVKEDNSGGNIDISNINTEIIKLGTIYKGAKTTIDLNGTLMQSSPLKITWEFDPYSQNDNFLFSGSLGTLPSKDLNAFTKPNLNTGFEGEIDQLFFTIDGNKTDSKIDVRMKYENFKVEILKEDGEQKNKLLSGIVNLFIKKESGSNGSEFKEATAEATRDKTKSIFNFIWLNLRNGLIKTLTSS